MTKREKESWASEERGSKEKCLGERKNFEERLERKNVTVRCEGFVVDKIYQWHTLKA